MSDPPAREYYVVNPNAIEFTIPREFEFLEYLGAGNYGNVILVREDCPDLQQGYVDLAVKKMHIPFDTIIKARRLYREFKLLQLMNHENVIRFVEIYTPDATLASFRNVYIVTRYAGLSLKNVLDKQKLSHCTLLQASHIKYIVYQILRALKYLHSANVIHRDLKPSNLAISGECDITVLDFGLARTVSQTGDFLTAYVISRWYRSPEVIYWNNVSYNAKADLWSVGCIMAELLTGEVLFRGAEAMEQYKLIVELCGAPDNELLDKIEAQNSAAMRSVVERVGEGRTRQDFKKFFAGQPNDAIDLLDKFLVLDPDRRISVEEALTHPYVQEHHLPSDEPVATHPFNIDDQNDAARTIDEWKEIIWNEIQNQHDQNGDTMDVE